MDYSAHRTRLSKKMVRQSQKQLLLVFIGTVLILAGIVKFGVPFMLFIIGNKSSPDTSVTNNKPSYIAPPELNSYASATNSAQIKLTGTASAKETIVLYVNDQLADTTSTKDDGSFSFDTVNLQNGDNTIKTKAKINDKTSDFSNTLTVTYKNKAPSLDITSPSDGQTFSKDNSANVVGKTDPDVTVTVNDFRAIVGDAGNFSYTLQLQNGDNQIKVVATDAAGNKTEKDLKVTFNP